VRSQEFTIATRTSVLLLVISAASTIVSGSVSAYTNQQTPQTSDCGSGEISTNVGCQNIGSGVQGGESVVVSTAQQTFPETKLVQEKPNHLLPPPPLPEEICGDQIDNDEDKLVDEDCPTEIVCDDCLVHVLWEDNTLGSQEILYKRDGTGFNPMTVTLSNNDGGLSIAPEVAVSGANVHVVWVDDTTGNFDIFYKRSTDGGATFDSTINLSNNDGDSEFPMIAVLGNEVHVVWHDDTPGNFDIMYRKSTDGGASFTEPTKNLSNNAGTSFDPVIALSGNNVHVAWRDNTPGNFDILDLITLIR